VHSESARTSPEVRGTARNNPVRGIRSPEGRDLRGSRSTAKCGGPLVGGAPGGGGLSRRTRSVVWFHGSEVVLNQRA